MFFFGGAALGYTAVAGDWNGDGIDTIGLFDLANAAWFLRDTNSSGPATYTFNYGAAGYPFYLPVTGDWNADGIDTPGLYDSLNAAWFLKNSQSAGAADVAFIYGAPGAKPIAGDWNR